MKAPQHTYQLMKWQAISILGVLFWFPIISPLQFQTDTTKNEPQTHRGIKNREDKLDTIHNSVEFSS